jgi:hypothetical protein
MQPDEVLVVLSQNRSGCWRPWQMPWQLSMGKLGELCVHLLWVDPWGEGENSSGEKSRRKMKF